MSEPFANYLKELTKRGVAILIDDATPPGRAVLLSPAQSVSPEVITELLNITGGVLSVGISQERAEAFRLLDMGRPATINEPLSPRQKRFTISVEAREGVTTGISAADRAATIRILGEKAPNPRLLVSPGHIFPVVLREGGVLVRSALFEGALDIVTAAGHTDAVAIIDALSREGEFLTAEQALRLGADLQIPTATLADLVRYRLASENLVYRVAEAKLPTKFGGEMRSIVYRSKLHQGEHIALVKGEISAEQVIPTRVQLEFTFGDVFGGDNPPSRRQIEFSLRAINAQPSGVFIYLRRPRTGQISSQVKAWQSSFDEKPASATREYGLGAQILRDLGARRIALLTDSPKGYSGIENFGIEIVSQQAIPYP